MNLAIQAATERYWRVSSYLLSGHAQAPHAEHLLRAVAEASAPDVSRLAKAAGATLEAYYRRRQTHNVLRIA